MLEFTGEQLEHIWWAVFWSATFFGETKIGIPYALYNDIPVLTAYFTCCIANCLAFPITMGFLDFAHERFAKNAFYNRYFNRFLKRTRKQTIKVVRKYGYLGILIFVMFPVPMTGAYVGSVACWLFEMNRKKSFVAVAIGAFIAGAILVMAYQAGMFAAETIETFAE